MDYYNKKALVVLVGLVITTLSMHSITAFAQYEMPKPGGSVKLRQLSDQEAARVYLIQRVGTKEYRQWDRVISAESEWEQGAINERTGDYCLAQINEDAWDKVAERLELDYKNDYNVIKQLIIELFYITCINTGGSSIFNILYLSQNEGFTTDNNRDIENLPYIRS
jgi:hypothetical protein